MNTSDFFKFGDLSSSMQYIPDTMDKESIDQTLKKYGFLATNGRLLTPTTYILDYDLKKYIAMSENIEKLLGYSAQYFMKYGFDSFRELTEKSDLKIIKEKVLPYNFDFLQKIPKEEHGNYIFSHNYRIHSATKHILTFYQQNTFIISPETGLPHYSIGVLADIGHLKKDTSILHQIGKMVNVENADEKEILFSTTYYPSSDLLTSREIEILKLMAEGMNSKVIAKKLYVSESTVINHRKNMLTKSSSKNVAQMIAYGIRNQII